MVKLTGNEKSFIGGLLAFLATSITQLQQTANYTLRDFGLAVGAWVVVHLGIWLTTNTVPSPAPTLAPDSTHVDPASPSEGQGTWIASGPPQGTSIAPVINDPRPPEVK